jgi:integrase
MAKRRGHGEGSIHQRKDGRWCASVDLGRSPTGKRVRKNVYGKTRKEVADKLKALHNSQGNGVDLSVERVTVSVFLDRWLADIVSTRNKARTYDGYKQIVDHHLKPHLGKHQLAKLTPVHVQAMLNSLAAAGKAPNTLRNIRAVLRRALNQGVRWQLIQRNAATLVDVPQHTKKETFTSHALDEQQARALLKAVAGHRLEPLYRLALSLGLRRGEVLGLLWTDIDFDRATLRITGAIQRLRGELQRTTTKTRASMQPITLPPLLLETLRSHRERQAEERKNAGDQWEEHGLVFTTTIGTPIEPRNLIRHFKTVLEKAKLPSTIRFHDLRHTAATLLILQGVHPRVVMEILRHSQISTTMNTYAHVLPSLQKDATAQLETLLNRTEPVEDAEEENASANPGETGECDTSDDTEL